MRRLGLACAAAFLVACGSGHGAEPDGPGVDAPPTAATLTAYVIDLVENQTSLTNLARPYAEFETLPDPDQANAAAYAPLFP